MRILFVAILAAFASVQAVAGEAATAKAPEPGTSVEMPYLIAPIVVDQALVGYAYVSCKIIGSSQQAAVDIRLATPFIQDAFVRDANATPLSQTTALSATEAGALASRLLADAKRIAGAKKVVDLKLIQIQISLFRPNSQT